MAAMMLAILQFAAVVALCLAGNLQPQTSETRQVTKLDNMWNFRMDTSPSRMEGFLENWYTTDLSTTGDVIDMPVPSSFNDITTDAKVRDYVGWVWYDTRFYIDPSWLQKTVMLNFRSCHYNCIVYVNGKQAMSHSGGHLPFEEDVTKLLVSASSNLITVAVNNTLSPHTLPPGTIEYKNDTSKYPPGYFVQNLQMDFFNYAGIHRSVYLYTLPTSSIQDIRVTTINASKLVATVNYTILTQLSEGVEVKVTLLDSERNIVVKVIRIDSGITEGNRITQGQIVIPIPKLWWPYTNVPKGETAGYLYSLQVELYNGKTLVDVYRQRFGIRTVHITNKQLYINNEPFYCQGVAKHEDSVIRGKGVDLPLIARDFNLLKFLNANCFRTSHYPYADEIMDMADKHGIAVIDESPGVGIKEQNLNNISLAHHMDVMKEMIYRDQNRPSVIMWSIANEPQSGLEPARYYFKTLVDLVRNLDPSRLVTYVIGPGTYRDDKAAEYLDILCVNRYYGWYEDIGHLEVIGLQLMNDLTNWHKSFDKPVIMTEYGADTVTSLHSLPSSSFTEEYQVDFLREYHKVFDKLKTDFLVGEMVWNFADFMTIQGVNRVYGNRKGLFTRDRQPKPAAFLVSNRYKDLLLRTTTNNQGSNN